MKRGEAVSVRAKRTIIPGDARGHLLTRVGALLALVASVVSAACDSSSGGSSCFPPEHGPADTSCAGFDLGLSCPVGVTPFYTCTCTKSGSAQSWVCAPAGGGGGAGTGGSAGSGGSAGTGGTDGGP
jgi:hypothetical protein